MFDIATINAITSRLHRGDEATTIRRCRAWLAECDQHCLGLLLTGCLLRTLDVSRPSA